MVVACECIPETVAQEDLERQLLPKEENEKHVSHSTCPASMMREQQPERE